MRKNEISSERVNVLEMKCLSSMVLVTRKDSVRNQEVHRMAGMVMELSSRLDQRVLRWFEHVERMDEEHMTKKK